MWTAIILKLRWYHTLQSWSWKTVKNPAVRCDWRVVWRLAELQVVRRNPPPGSWNLFTADTLTGVSININDAPIHSGVTRTAWQRGNMNHTRSPETEAAKWNSAINLCYFLWRITYWDCGSILKHKHGVKWFLPLPRLLWMDRIITDKWLFLFFLCAFNDRSSSTDWFMFASLSYYLCADVLFASALLYQTFKRALCNLWLLSAITRCEPSAAASTGLREIKQAVCFLWLKNEMWCNARSSL